MPGQVGHSGMPASGAPPVHPGQRQQRESAAPDNPVSRETNYKKCTVRTIDGTTIHGNVNISGVSRLSDLFANEAATFIVMVDVRMGGGNGKTIFINKDHIVWVEPLDDTSGE